MSLNTEKLDSILQLMVRSTNNIQGAALITVDGLPIACNLPGKMDEERVAAMSAAMLSLGERISSELARGTTERIFVEGERGYAILTSCGDEAVFLVLASKEAKQGILMLAIKQVVADIKQVLKSFGEDSQNTSYHTSKQNLLKL